jgi:FMN phosphatase YigB (HAD superfamily)
VASSEIFSCDVFDTVITRAVGASVSVFLLLGRMLSARGTIRVSPEAFARLRREAARRAKVNQGACYTLRHIYGEVQFAMGLSDAERDAIMTEELTLEARLVRPVPGARERLARVRESGTRVVFLSDMYMGTQPIRSLLERYGLCGEGDGCYVSCEIGATKLGGKAFRAMAELESVPLHRIRHYGNSHGADIASARKVGVRAKPFFEGNLNRYEETLESHAFATDGLASVLAGASRLARLSVRADSPGDVALRDAAAGVGAPALVAYVLWILLRSRELGIRRLYFLARDGFIMLEIARRLIEKLGLDCEARYLYGGRKAWYVPSITGVAPEDLFWALDYASPDASIEKFLGRLDLAPAEIEEALDELGHPRATWARARSRQEQQALLEIPAHPAVREILLSRAAARREEVLAYFEQEGLLKHPDWAVVDVGWSGRLLGAMNKILRTGGAEVRTAFFFARFSDREKHNLDPVSVLPYFSDRIRRQGHAGVLNELYLEMFCGADEGPTVGYRKGPGGIVPILEKERNEVLTRWGLPIVHETILSFADHLWLEPGLVGLSADARPAVSQLLQAFTRSPTVPEANAWGIYPFEYGLNGAVTATIATPFTVRQLLRILVTRKVKGRRGTEWTAASVAMSPSGIRLLGRTLLAIHRRFGKRRSVAAGAYDGGDLAPPSLPQPPGTQDDAPPREGTESGPAAGAPP